MVDEGGLSGAQEPGQDGNARTRTGFVRYGPHLTAISIAASRTEETIFSYPVPLLSPSHFECPPSRTAEDPERQGPERT